MYGAGQLLSGLRCYIEIGRLLAQIPNWHLVGQW